MILSLLPVHCTRYCEPFVGAGWVFLGYEGADTYVLNDADPEVAAMWSYMKGHTLGDFLKERFDLIRSEAVFRENKLIYKSKTWKSDAQLLYLYRYLQYYGVMGDYETPIAEGSSLRKKPMLPVENYEKVHSLLTLRSVHVTNEDWKDCCQKHDAESVVFYFDPPWQGNICQDRYGHHAVEYAEILNFIRQAKGFVLMTCNESALEGMDLLGLKVETVKQKYASCNFVKNLGGRKVEDSSVVFVVKESA